MCFHLGSHHLTASTQTAYSKPSSVISHGLPDLTTGRPKRRLLFHRGNQTSSSCAGLTDPYLLASVSLSPWLPRLSLSPHSCAKSTKSCEKL